jgi:hypothetical protein
VLAKQALFCLKFVVFKVTLSGVICHVVIGANIANKDFKVMNINIKRAIGKDRMCELRNFSIVLKLVLQFEKREAYFQNIKVIVFFPRSSLLQQNSTPCAILASWETWHVQVC